MKEKLIAQAEKLVQLESKLAPFLSGGAKMVTEADLTKAEGALKKLQLEWKKRKRATIDAMGAIAESMEMNPKDFATKVGIETDEEFKVVCPL